METLLHKLEFEGWSDLFLLSDTQRKFAKPKMYEFYGKGLVCYSVVITFVRRKPIYLVSQDIGRILGIPYEGWDHYVRHEYLL